MGLGMSVSFLMFAVKLASVSIDYADPRVAPMSAKRKPRTVNEWPAATFPGHKGRRGETNSVR